MSGVRSDHAGLAAEDIVQRAHEVTGHSLLARRWCGEAGEIDLILDDAADTGGLVFVEVKSVATHDAALRSLSPRQLVRIALAAEEDIGSLAPPALFEKRIDLASVDGEGRVEIVPNIAA